ncbi:MULTISPECIES: DUF4064 domain-containing protein [Mammaliicoccus]|uniref:DUF4064 domain-containing protein n=1 Tax=Mammaliicoccus TaxID=2803850 RepID=UPI000E069463|nr:MULTISPECIES: DUF4064 domain-containing protein [Mammaliicoccus]HCN60319.1 hypothetical protein [Staphylococcus sp.]MEB6200868.1 DUF4064 domain-containing protein [Mammaliicoccus fleurettii]RIL49816.1 DUF4064 domain-containing protein [Mammaliicoccus fleurettii]RTX87124.1 DUF4064 domain-containing protein [Mammaliicoccus fleurettii]SUM35481.1 membrane protein [Mammaliicoccus fleurettii]
MIKRTTERTFIWIGIAVQILILLVCGLLLWYSNSDGAVIDMMNSNSISIDEAKSTLNILSGFMIIELIWGVILMGLAITSIVWTDKKTRVAGIILIVIGILSIILNWVAVIMWIIAGTMLIRRKPKTSLYNEFEENNESFQDENPFLANEKNSNDSEDYVEEQETKNDVEDPYKY